jgi:hypothetical protein
MSKVLTVPYRLQTGTSFKDSLPVLNDNFMNLSTSFNGFAAENTLGFPDNTSGTTLAAGAMSIFITPGVASSPNDPTVIMYPKVSLFVDPPVITDPTPTSSYDLNYLFPTGAALTGGQKSVLISAYCSNTKAGTTTSFVSSSDGKTYYYARDIVYVIRNADAVSHSYFLTINPTVYTTNASFYR